MNKATIRDVAISCALFLGFVFLMSLCLEHYLPTDDKTTKAVVSTQDKKIVYLTFDDGPSANTKSVLDILDKYDVLATFFVTGENPAYEDYIFKEFEKGHAIGIHTYSHDYGTIYASSEAYMEDMEKMNRIIKKQIGHKVNIMRFPGGASNTVSRNYRSGIMSELSKIMEDKGYQYYDWNASNGDGDSYKSADQLIQTAINEVGDKSEVMMLMHDGTGNKATLEALPAIIEMLKEKGYEFRIIDNSTSVFHHHIAN